VSPAPRAVDPARTGGPESVAPDLSLQEGLGFRLSRLARNLRRDWAEQLGPVGLTPPQAAVLRGLAAEPGCSVRALSRALGSDPMNVKRCVDELEHRGLVASGSLPGDRRPRALTLTDSGTRLAGAADRLARSQQEWLAGGLAPDEARALDAALERIEGLLGLGGTDTDTDTDTDTEELP